MLPPYAKPHLSFADQVSLLAQRGLGITDAWQAERHLARIGYYRLKDYLHPLRLSRQTVAPDGSRYTEVLEEFRPGTTFTHAVQLYVFDKRLRLLMADAIERIEVALRVDVAYTLGKNDAFAHRNIAFLDPKRSVVPQGGGTRHQQWLQRADESEARSRADMVQQFRSKYAPPLPIWMAVETWDFGALSQLVNMAHPSDRAVMSRKYDLSDPQVLTSWIRALSHVRNVCAHHSRLWNHPLVSQPKVPKGNDAPLVQHISTYGMTATRIYAAAAVAQHFLRIVHPNSSWKTRLIDHWNRFPVIPGVNAGQAGFLPTWRSHQLWQ